MDEMRMNQSNAIPLAPPQPESIFRTIEADVVVVGAGIAGLTAGASAAEAGAKTVILEKGPTFNVRGLHNAALNSRLQRQAGICVDKDRVISTIMEFGAYRGDQRIVKLWADNCSDVMDWLLDLADAAGVKVALDPTTKSWHFPNYPLIHVFYPDRQVSLARMLLAKACAHGAETYFSTPAVMLERDGQGRVSGVIARDNEGHYVRFAASRGVILCSGDYGADRRMVEAFCNWGVLPDLKCAYEGGLNTGDGLKMATWVGAAMDTPPHCPMLFDWAVWAERGLFNLARQPWLYVNNEGERFMNEDLPWGYECNQIVQQSDRKAWAVWDDKFAQEVPIMHSQCCKNMGPPTNLWSPSQLEDALARGNVLKADDIGSLAQRMGVPVAAFGATVNRYNAMAFNGRDEDFGKHPDRLTTLRKPPYYACQMEVRYMVILGGLRINTRLEVLDTDRRPIPGLYAAGNVSGSFFGQNVYATTAPGVTHSRAWTFGRLAGLNAAAASKHH
jgi:fumarate reductase flavoprotein subunit